MPEMMGWKEAPTRHRIGDHDDVAGEIMAKQERRFRREDVGQIAVGACGMAFPAAVTEEVRTLGAEIELGRARHAF